jgi:hypothetical protein
VSLVLRGTNFFGGITTVDLGSGIRVNSTSIDSSTQITMNVTILTSAPTGQRDVKVNNAAPGGGRDSLKNGFTVNNPVPRLAQIAPTNATRLQTLDVVFTGSNFISGVTTFSLGSGITTVTAIVNSDTQLTASVRVDSNAATGLRDASVTNPAPGGGIASLTNGFTVGNPAPTISSLSPSSKTVGDPAFQLSVNGTNFVPGTIVRLDSVDHVTTAVTTTQIQATIPSADLDTAHVFKVTTYNPGGGISNAVDFAVNNPLPTLATIVPDSATRLQTLSIVFTGTGFIRGVTTVSFGDTNIVVNSTTVNSTSQLTVSITVAAGAAFGTRNVSVSNPTPGGAHQEPVPSG